MQWTCPDCGVHHIFTSPPPSCPHCHACFVPTAQPPLEAAFSYGTPKTSREIVDQISSSMFYFLIKPRSFFSVVAQKPPSIAFSLTIATVVTFLYQILSWIPLGALSKTKKIGLLEALGYDYRFSPSRAAAVMLFKISSASAAIPLSILIIFFMSFLLKMSLNLVTKDTNTITDAQVIALLSFGSVFKLLGIFLPAPITMLAWLIWLSMGLKALSKRNLSWLGCASVLGFPWLIFYFGLLTTLGTLLLQFIP